MTFQEFILTEFVRKVKGGYVVFSRKGRQLSKPSSKKKALKRLKAIEYFKHKG